MSKISYYLKRIKNLNRGKLSKTFGRIKEKSGKNTVFLSFDMLLCAVKYGCGYTDYEFSEWWNLDKNQRKTYITRGKNDNLVKKVNDESYSHILENKCETFEFFGSLMGRGYFNFSSGSSESFSAFMENREKIIVKPIDGYGGIGIRILNKSDYPSVDEMYSDIISNNGGIAEDLIAQHSEMSRLYPHSVNTLRVVTVLSGDGMPHIIYASVRIGRGGSFTDNLTSGGMSAPIDTETGKICGVAYGRDCSVFEKHPDTGTEIKGFQIPNWDKVVSLVLGAAPKIPQIRYIGWDVAVTEGGATFVEVNPHPGYGFVQFPANTPDKIGIIPKLEEALGGKI